MELLVTSTQSPYKVVEARTLTELCAYVHTLGYHSGLVNKQENWINSQPVLGHANEETPFRACCPAGAPRKQRLHETPHTIPHTLAAALGGGVSVCALRSA